MMTQVDKRWVDGLENDDVGGQERGWWMENDDVGGPEMS